MLEWYLEKNNLTNIIKGECVSKKVTSNFIFKCHKHTSVFLKPLWEQITQRIIYTKTNLIEQILAKQISIVIRT